MSDPSPELSTQSNVDATIEEHKSAYVSNGNLELHDSIDASIPEIIQPNESIDGMSPQEIQNQECQGCSYLSGFITLILIEMDIKRSISLAASLLLGFSSDIREDDDEVLSILIIRSFFSILRTKKKQKVKKSTHLWYFCILKINCSLNRMEQSCKMFRIIPTKFLIFLLNCGLLNDCN